MGCCGQGRAAVRARSAPAREEPGVRRAGVAPGPATAAIRYTGGGQVRVRGAASGRLYLFARGERAEVAAADVPTLVRTGLFARD
jgi:hypothetical protein